MIVEWDSTISISLFSLFFGQHFEQMAQAAPTKAPMTRREYESPTGLSPTQWPD